jgi:hypothetical protein
MALREDAPPDTPAVSRPSLALVPELAPRPEQLRFPYADLIASVRRERKRAAAESRPAPRHAGIQLYLVGGAVSPAQLAGWTPSPRAPQDDASPASEVAPSSLPRSYSEFPGRALNREERRLRDELRAIEQDPTSEWSRYLAARPKTLGECQSQRQPGDVCTRASCRYNLAIDVNEHGSLKIHFPDGHGGVAWESMPATCALDVATDGPHHNREIGEMMRMSEEGVRTIEKIALEKLGPAAEALAGIRLPSGRVRR